ncbi:substrate-binding domain-containing protein [Streptomyces sp. NPDC102462]|uniref:substrate-binding domain-containing protein n=1 Tax=Streptomyces sp. NPDC102462 TaxID=3366178 RepID=UPI003828DEE1
MGRHSLPDRSRAGAADPRPRARRRSIAVATVLVLTVAAGTAAVRGGLLSFGSSCQDDPVRLTLAAAPDLAPALRAAAERAREEDVTSDGRCIALTVSAQDSFDVADTLRRGGKPDAQVWVPDSEVWVERVAADARATQVNQLGHVAASPVGVAMLPAAARSLGWPKKTYTWTELAGAALQGGAPRLGAADPARSATGLLALTRLNAAAAGAKNGQTRAAAMMKALAQRVSATDEQVLRTLPRDASSGTEQDDPERNTALILSEQAAFAHNATADPNRRLDLFYPTDGSPSLDHPYALVDEAELTTDESRAAVRFMTYLRQPAQHRLLEKYGFRTDDDAVPRTVVDRAGGSTPQPYAEPSSEPPTGSALQQALGTWTITVQSARITTVVDASASMAQAVPGTARTRMDVTRAALLQALDTFTAEDEIGLWEFATRLDGDADYRVLVPTERLGDRKGDGTQRDRLSAAFGGLEPVPGGATGLYDTTLAAYRAATASYAKGRFNALVVLTDGVNEDPGSISRSALVAELEKLSDPERPVPLVVIAVGPEASRDEAARLAGATGGIAEMVDDPAQIHAVILKAIVAAGAAGAAGAGDTAG